MEKKIYVFAALALALVICAAAGLQPAVCACAAYSMTDPAEPDPTNPVDPEPEDFAYDDVYFFTNRSNASAAGSKMYLELVLRYYGAFDFHFQIYDLFNQWGLSWSSLSVPVNDNSVVIFEISGIDAMCFQYDYANGVFLSELNDGLVSLFSGWKNDGCRIILLNDTEEVRLLDENLEYDTSPYTEFLDFVDVHINTDFFTLFVDTILSNAFDNEFIDNFVFLLDASLVTVYYFPFKNGIFEYENFFLREFLFPYMLMTDGDFFVDCNSDWRVMLVERNIHIVRCEENGDFFDMTTQQNFHSYSDFYENCNVPAENFIAIGTDRHSGAYTENWLSDMTQLRALADRDFEIYLFQSGGENEAIQEYYDEIKRAWTVDAIYLDEFWNIFDAVVRDGDFSVFNNWSGRCLITYKPITGGGGWLNSGFIALFKLKDEEWMSIYGLSPA